MRPTRRLAVAASALAAFATVSLSSNPAISARSSHREAPGIRKMPMVDGTDFYMFRSYEPGREDFVTIIANYLPLQDPAGGPNYFDLDDDALYEVHIDNNGDAEEDITFQFRFETVRRDLQLPIGPPGGEVLVSVPLVNVGPISGPDDPNQNIVQNYTVDVIFGDRRTGTRVPVTNTMTGETSFEKPLDNIGGKSIPNYASYASNFVYDVDLPGGFPTGRMFVGQRKDPFVISLGEVFDLVNLDPTGPPDAEANAFANKNVTSFVLELPIASLTQGTEPVIGGWTSASLRQARVLNPNPFGPDGKIAHVRRSFTQVSRLSSPLVNEVVIGLKDKDRFNASEPKDDAQFMSYITHPTLPAVVDILFGTQAPLNFPRGDLVAAFLTGISGINQPAGVVPSEMLRLDTQTPITPSALQSRLGLLDNDMAGFPNGRRPGDDVVDIQLRTVMGAYLTPGVAPSGQMPFTDGAIVDSSRFDNTFPYLLTPLPGAQ